MQTGQPRPPRLPFRKGSLTLRGVARSGCAARSLLRWTDPRGAAPMGSTPRGAAPMGSGCEANVPRRPLPRMWSVSSRLPLLLLLSAPVGSDVSGTRRMNRPTSSLSSRKRKVLLQWPMLRALRERLAESRQAFSSVFTNPNLRRVELSWAGTGARVHLRIAALALRLRAGRRECRGAGRAPPGAAVAHRHPFGTLLGDRFPRERVIVAINVARSVTIAGAAVAAFAAPPRVWSMPWPD